MVYKTYVLYVANIYSHAWVAMSGQQVHQMDVYPPNSLQLLHLSNCPRSKKVKYFITRKKEINTTVRLNS